MLYLTRWDSFLKYRCWSSAERKSQYPASRVVSPVRPLHVILESLGHQHACSCTIGMYRLQILLCHEPYFCLLACMAYIPLDVVSPARPLHIKPEGLGISVYTCLWHYQNLVKTNQMIVPIIARIPSYVHVSRMESNISRPYYVRCTFTCDGDQKQLITWQ